MGRALSFSFWFSKQFLAHGPGQGLWSDLARLHGKDEKGHRLGFSTAMRKSSAVSTCCGLTLKEPSSGARKILQQRQVSSVSAGTRSDGTAAVTCLGNQRKTPSAPIGTSDYRTTGVNMNGNKTVGYMLNTDNDSKFFFFSWKGFHNFWKKNLNMLIPLGKMQR